MQVKLDNRQTNVLGNECEGIPVKNEYKYLGIIINNSGKLKQ